MEVTVALAVTLASVFGVAGGTKVVLGKAGIQDRMPWAEDFSGLGVRVIGLVELAASAGLFLGVSSGGSTLVTSLSATVASAVMLGAGAVHIRRKEYANLLPVLALLALSLAVLLAIGRR